MNIFDTFRKYEQVIKSDILHAKYIYSDDVLLTLRTLDRFSISKEK